MPYTVPTYVQIRDQYLQAVLNQNAQAAIGPDSDYFVRACGIAAVVEGIYSHQAWVFRQAFPDLADDDILAKHASYRGLSLKPANAAAGFIRFNGTAGTPVPGGQTVTTAQGISFATTVAANVGVGGTVDIAAVASIAGAAGNQTDNTPATVNSPPLGVTTAATLLTMNGGADVESYSSLLNRLLLELAEIAQGGNEMDYQRWALSVPGVDRAFVFPVRRGAGTVDVVAMPSTGLPSGPLLAAVQAVLDAKRPVGMLPGYGVLALAPTALATNVTALLTLKPGYTLAGVQPEVQAAIATVFSALRPGGVLVRNQLITAILNVEGVTDVTLSAPGANVTSLVSSSALELVTPGVVALSV